MHVSSAPSSPTHDDALDIDSDEEFQVLRRQEQAQHVNLPVLERVPSLREERLSPVEQLKRTLNQSKL